MNPFTKFPALKWVAVAAGGIAVAVGVFFGIKAFMSSDGEIDLGMVPDDVDFVVSVNLQKALDQTGVKITDEGIELPEELSDYEDFIDEDVADLIARCNKAIETRQILAFGYIKADDYRYGTPKDIFLLAKVNDKAMLQDLLENEADLTLDNDEGFDIYSKKHSDATILVKDGYAWFVGGYGDSKALKRVQKLLDHASENSIKDKEGIVQNINNGSICTVNFATDKIFKLMNAMSGELPTQVAVAVSAMADKMKGNWVNYSFNLEGTTASLKAKVYKPKTGETVDFGVSQPVDTHFLTYIPADFQCVAAFAIKPDYVAQICDGIQAMVDSEYDSRVSNASSYYYYYDDSYTQTIRQEQQLFHECLDAVRNIDGTVGGGIGFSDLPALFYGGKTSGMRFVLTAKMKPGAAENLKGIIRRAMPSTDVADSTVVFASEPTDALMIPLDRDFTLYVKTVDNDLVIANFDVTSGNTNNFASAVQGNDMIMSVKIPSFKELTNGQCNYGLDTEYKYAKGEASYTLDITNCKETIVGAIINLAKGIQAGSSSYYRSHNSYSYSYDYPVPADFDTVVEEVAVEEYAY